MRKQAKINNGQSQQASYQSSSPSVTSKHTHRQKSAKEGKNTEKPIRKGYKLFFENYVFYVVGLNVDSCSIKGKCYRSQKKSQVPRNMTVNLSNNGDIINAKCNCVAGASDFCCHVMALLYLIDHTLKLGLETFPRVGTCTDNPQQWHKPRTLGIKAEPIMGISVIDPKHEKKRFSGIQSTLFEARQDPAQNSSGANSLHEKIKQHFPNLGFAEVFSDSKPTVQTKLSTKVPIGECIKLPALTYRR